MRLLTRIFVFLLVVTFFVHIFSISAFAQETPSTMPFSLPQTEQGVPRDVHTLSQSVILGMLSFATCALSGIDLTYSDHRCLGYDSQTGKLGFVQNPGSISSFLIEGIALTYQKPLQTSDYFHYLAGNFGVVKQSYAANQDGFAQLSPLLTIWLGMRNVSYVLFVLIFIITGFAIMLRAKIDPRTVMTIQNQIPKLIIALLLISFSFAIAGLVVDFMWVLSFITINLFASLDPQLARQIGSITSAATDSPLSLANSVSGGGGFLGIAGQAAGGIKDITQSIAHSFFQTFAGTIISDILAFFDPISVIGCVFPAVAHIISFGIVGSDFTTCANNVASAVVASIGGIIAFLIFTIALIVALTRLWWTLIKSYALFIVYVIFGPLMIMAGVLPGSKINFENWLRHLLAYTLVFPTAIGILLLGKVVMDVYGGGPSVTPPLLGTLPSALGPLLGFAIIMLLPQSLTIVQDALQAPDMKYLPAVGAMMAAGTTATTTLFTKPWQRLTRKQNKMEGLNEGPLRKWVMNRFGGWPRRFAGEEKQ